MTVTSSRWIALAALALTCSTPAMAKDWKTVTVAMEGSYAPWNQTDASGKIVGFEVDILNDVCARAKLECNIVAQDWDGVIPGSPPASSISSWTACRSPKSA